MESSRYIGTSHHARRAGFRAWSLALAVVICGYGAAGSTAVHAQATVASVFGWAPSGETITVQSTSGVHRHTNANSKGRYKLGSLPLGTYTVTLEKDGKVVDTRSNIKLTVGGGAEVDFACPQDHCEEPAGTQ